MPSFTSMETRPVLCRVDEVAREAGVAAQCELVAVASHALAGRTIAPISWRLGPAAVAPSRSFGLFKQREIGHFRFSHIPSFSLFHYAAAFLLL